MTTKEIDAEIARLQKLKEEIVHSREIDGLQKYVGKYFVHKIDDVFGKVRAIDEYNHFLICNTVHFWVDSISIERTEELHVNSITIISKEEFDAKFSKAVTIMEQCIKDNYVFDADGGNVI